MRSGVGLCVLALLCLHSSVFGQEAQDAQPGVLIFCDDASVEKAASSAVHKFNENLSTGNQLALFQILSASKSENGANSVYSLQFTTRRSDCPAGDNKHWTDCNYLPHGHRSPFSCNATVHMSETDADTKQVDCLIDHITPERAPCMGCPEDIDENSDDIRVPLAVSISKFNSISNSTHLFTLHSVGPSTRQVVAGLRFNLRFDLRRSTCAKADHKDLHANCVPDEENVVFTNCNSTVDIAPWRQEAPETHLECEDGALPVRMFSRRRPPGWSPLRNMFDVAPSSTKPSPSNPPPPPSPNTPSQKLPMASAKEESSEEDTTASKPTSATRAEGDVNNSPFHCPSKPWKPFHPVHPPMPGAPTKAATTLTSILSDFK